MGEAIDRLVRLTKVVHVPAHGSVTKTGEPVHVDAYSYVRRGGARARFETYQRKYRELADRKNAFQMGQLLSKYGSVNPPSSWLTSAERKKLESLRAQESRVMDSMMGLLEKIGGRSWRSGVPVHWIMSSLSFEDATTKGPLSVVPPPGYGHTEAELRRFAEARG